MDGKSSQQGKLKSSFSPLGMWAFSIGTSIGWGSFIVTCSTYLSKSGLLGTVFGLLVGMAVIFLITWNLQYMIRNSPDSGGIYTFENRLGGRDLGFIAFWFVLLTYFAILWANITSVPLFARFFLGDTFRFGFRYTIFKYEVWFGEALISILVFLLIAFLCMISARIPGKIMTAAALIFAAGFTACAVLAFIRHDASFDYSPLYTEESPAFSQIVRIAAISPWAFIGFENISHFSEEYKFPVKKVRSVLIASVIVTTLLYLFVSVLSVSAYPPEYASWLDYIRDMGNLEGIKAVPAFYAAQHYLGQTGVTVLMISLFAVILTSLIGNLLALSRLLYAAGREGDAPRSLARVSKKGVPYKAMIAVAAVSVLIPFLGRTAIGWIVDVTTLGATLIYGLISHGVLRHARNHGRKAEKITGAAGILVMFVFVVLILVPGLLPFDAMETESYVLFIVWSVLGLVYFRVLVIFDKNREYNNRFVVWIILLMLVLFASMMWVSRETENAADRAVQNIYEYHENHPTDGTELAEEERAAFLKEQANQITKTNTLYTIASLSVFVLSAVIMLNNYQDTKKLGEHLDAARKTANIDFLTGVGNKNAFSDAVSRLNAQIRRRERLSFAMVICDINDLKSVNDTKGHIAGDACIRKAGAVISGIFSDSSVFRIGGDEFAVICQDGDYDNIDALMEKMIAEGSSNGEGDGVQIACGMARYGGDDKAEAVFERADRQMYEVKMRMKVHQ